MSSNAQPPASELPFPDDVFGHIVNYLQVKDLFKLELTCKAYSTGIWYDYLTFVSSRMLTDTPTLLPRLQRHHKRITSLETSDGSSKAIHSFLSQLLPQLTSISIEFYELLPQLPTGPVYELSRINRANLESLTIGMTKNSRVDSSGTLSSLQWLASGFPNVKHLDIRIHIKGQVKDTLDAILSGFSSLQSLSVMVGPSTIQEGEISSSQMVSCLSSICKKNAKTLKKLLLEHSELSEAAVGSLGVSDHVDCHKINERCKEIFAVSLSGFRLHRSESLWVYLDANPPSSVPLSALEAIFDLCYDSAISKIESLQDRLTGRVREEDVQYFGPKVASWLPDIIPTPTQVAVEILATLAPSNLSILEGLKNILRQSPQFIASDLTANVVSLLLVDSDWVAAVGGESLACITDSYNTLMSLLDRPALLLELVRAIGHSIFSCSRPHADTLSLLMDCYRPANPGAAEYKEAIKYILHLHENHPEQNRHLEKFLTGHSKFAAKLVQDEEFFEIISSIFKSDPKLTAAVQAIKNGTYQPPPPSFSFGALSAGSPFPPFLNANNSPASIGLFGGGGLGSAQTFPFGR